MGRRGKDQHVGVQGFHWGVKKGGKKDGLKEHRGKSIRGVNRT